jgi:hypothetical protein
MGSKYVTYINSQDGYARDIYDAALKGSKEDKLSASDNLVLYVKNLPGEQYARRAPIWRALYNLNKDNKPEDALGYLLAEAYEYQFQTMFSLEMLELIAEGKKAPKSASVYVAETVAFAGEAKSLLQQAKSWVNAFAAQSPDNKEMATAFYKQIAGAVTLADKTIATAKAFDVSTPEKAKESKDKAAAAKKASAASKKKAPSGFTLSEPQQLAIGGLVLLGGYYLYRKLTAGD